MAELTEDDVRQIVQQELAARVPQVVRDELAREAETATPPPADTAAADTAAPEQTVEATA